jgi:hypothetical protein
MTEIMFVITGAEKKSVDSYCVLQMMGCFSAFMHDYDLGDRSCGNE